MLSFLNGSGLLLLLILFVKTGPTLSDTPAQSSFITINGHSIGTGSLEIYSGGRLEVIAGTPRLPVHKPVAFRLVLLRNGQTIRQWPAADGGEIDFIALDDVWPHARPGDQLVIDRLQPAPAPAAATAGKWVIPIRPAAYKWFGTGDEC